MPDVTELGLTTNQLIARINVELGLTIDRNTVTAWTRREDCPLPVAYKGKPGQGHRYDWAAVRPWLDTEMARAAEKMGTDIDAMDWAQARTIKERERAKQAQMDTLSRRGELGSVAEMELEAEDIGRQAVQMLLAAVDRMAPLLAVEDDEVACATILDRELRRVCNEIADMSEHRGELMHRAEDPE
jgi:phage terminase Nu1 subunit (DNA packaging protein)